MNAGRAVWTAIAATLLIAAPVSAQNPFSGNAAAVEEGHQLYNESCTACHGYDGEAGDRAPALSAKRRYTRNTPRELFDAIRSGIPGTAMPPSSLSETDAWKVAAYIQSLRATAIDTPVKGDIARGEQIFWAKGECGNCHMLHGKGGLLGPDLSNIASQRKLSVIRSALTTKDARPSPGYVPVKIVAKDGRTVSGVLKNEHNFSFQVLGSDNELHLFTEDEVREVVHANKSMMPGDYDRRLTPDEMQDLVAFLSRQGTRKEHK